MKTKDDKTTAKGIRLMTATVVSLVAVTLILTVLDADLAIERRFYSDGKGWHLGEAPLWTFLYAYGTIPGIVLSLLALLGAFLSVFTPRLAPYRRHCMVVLLTAVLGAGIIVNAVLKPYWGRPRPREVSAFNGVWEYRHPHQIGIPGQGKSFTCGHCTMGFLFVTLFFFADRSRRLALAGGIFGLAFGSLLGLCRMIQGAHYLTDVIWSLGVILLVSQALHYILLPRWASFGTFTEGISRRRKIGCGMAALLLAFVITFAFLTRRPFYETYSHQFALTPETRTLNIQSNTGFVNAGVQYRRQDTATVLIHARGFGWVRASLNVHLDARTAGDGYRLECRLDAHGYFAELEYELQLILPERYKDRLQIRVEKKQKEK